MLISANIPLDFLKTTFDLCSVRFSTLFTDRPIFAHHETYSHHLASPATPLMAELLQATLQGSASLVQLGFKSQ